MRREAENEHLLRLAKYEWHTRIANKLSHKVSMLNGSDAIQMMKRIEAILGAYIPS